VLLIHTPHTLHQCLFEDILKSTSWNIYCLIDSKEFEETLNTIGSTLANSQCESIKSSSERIKFIKGDSSMSMLGLESFSNLIDTIIYDISNFDISNETSRSSNVLDFASQSPQKKVYLISSEHVNSELFGNELIISPELINAELHSSVAPWMIENRFLLQNKEQGLSVNVIKIGHLSDNKETNLIQQMVRNTFKFNVLPNVDDDEYLPSFLPVSHVSNSIISLMKDNKSNKKTFHIQNQNGSPRLSDLKNSLNLFVENYKEITFDEWSKLILGDSSLKEKLIPVFVKNETFEVIQCNSPSYLELFVKYISYYETLELYN
jgi:thioester reductase-like protein